MSGLRIAVVGLGLLASVSGPVGSQTVPKKDEPKATATKEGAKGAAPKAKKAAPNYRTITGKVNDVQAADELLTVALGDAAKKGAGGQNWILSPGNQTLFLRANKNGQFSAAAFGDLKAGDTIQAVADLAADETDRSHRVWWLVLYPEGTAPPAN